jgi:hypothetical protein
MSQNPCLFIVGAPRSGTTLLQRMVDAHPHIAITPESHWIPRWYEEQTGLTPEGFVTPDLIDSLLEYPKFGRLGFGREELEGLIKSGEQVPYSRFVTGIFDLYGKVQGKRLVGDKTPSYARRLRTLHSLWPKARFIHLIRDGRDVCLSYISWKKFSKRASLTPWDEDPVTTSALWWECHVRLAREVGSTLGPDLYYEIRYESLVANPAAECKALCTFLGVTYDDVMLRFHEGRIRTKPGLDAKRAWLPITSGLRDWKTQMSVEDVERFEASSGDLLDELNYPRAVRCPEPEAQKHAAMIRDSFAQAIRSRTRYQLSDRLSIVATLRRMDQNPYLFIVGCARSGTTLLQRVVDAHPHIAITPEIHWIANFKKREAGSTTNGFVTKEIVFTLLEHKRFPQLEVSSDEFKKLIGSDQTLSYAEFLTRFFNLYRKVKGKPLVGNKTPAYVRRILALHTLWPKARFVHLIRDGRDVCLSVMNWKKAGHSVGRYLTWEEDPVSTIALWWKEKVQLGRQAGHQLGPELYYEMRYEDLMANPGKECEALCQFLRVPYDEAMIRFHEDRTKTGPHFKGKRALLPITSGLRDWRKQMATEDVERFEALAGDLLDELDYARAVPHPKPEAQTHAASIYEVFTQDTCSKGHLLPEGW